MDAHTNMCTDGVFDLLTRAMDPFLPKSQNLTACMLQSARRAAHHLNALYGTFCHADNPTWGVLCALLSVSETFGDIGKHLIIDELDKKQLGTVFHLPASVVSTFCECF